jgi:trigger factor
MAEKECNCEKCDNEECHKDKDNTKFVASKNNGPLVKGYRSEKVIYPLALLQSRFEEMEETVNKNFNVVNQNRYHDFQMNYGKFVEVDNAIEELKFMVDALKTVLKVDEATFNVEMDILRKAATDKKELDEDIKSKRKAVDKVATDKDIVKFDFVGKINGEAFNGGAAQGHHLDLEHSNFIPGFAEQLVGVKAGEVKDVTVKFPDDYHSVELKGKEAVFTCTIKAVKEKIQ